MEMVIIIANDIYCIIGVCEPAEFQKALEKIGVAIPSKRDLE